jgi:hypothetical protein
MPNIVKRIGYTFTQPITANGGIITGSGGTSLNSLLAGSATVLVASTVAASTNVASFTATGVAAGNKVFVNATGLAACTLFIGASITGANVIAASIRTVGSATSASANVTFSYLAVA